MNRLVGTNPIIKITLSLALLTISGFIYGAVQTTHGSTSDHHATHKEQQDDDSVVMIVDSENILNTEKLAGISGPVMNKVYAEHYAKTDKIERTARYSGGLKSLGDDKYTFSMTFLPSNTTYAVNLTVINLETKQFTLEIQ